MDRLSAVIITTLALGGCPEADKSAAPLRTRVDAVKRSDRVRKADPPEEFCDLYTPDDAKDFSYPELASPAPSAKGWSWVNMWATWCDPCIEEMPMILEWEKKLRGAGKSFELVFLSVDESAEDEKKFRTNNPSLPPGPRVEDPDSVEEWLTGLGLDGGTAIPINLFVDPSGKLRCVRTGALAEHHFPTVRDLLR